MNSEAMLSQFLAAHETEPSAAHEQLIDRAYRTVRQELVESRCAIATVRLAHRIYGYLGAQGLRDRIELMRSYLHSDQDKRPEDQLWAHWELVDNLALLQDYETMIVEQEALLAWAAETLPPDALLKVMSDSTQAIGWVEAGQAEAWFALYDDIMARIVPTSANRRGRVLYVETAAGLLLYNVHRYDRAAEEIERYLAIVAEDPAWAEHDAFYLRMLSYRLGLYSALADELSYERTVNEALLFILTQIGAHAENDPEARSRVCDMAHDIGACLMWEQRHSQAIPLFAYALRHQGTGMTHYFYAVCVWAASRDREAALRHLRAAETSVRGNGGLRRRYKRMFLEQAEFAEVWADDDFLACFLD